MEWRSVGVGGLVVVAGCGLLAGCGAPGDAADGLDGDDARQEQAASMDAPRPPAAESLMHGDTEGTLFGTIPGAQLEVSIDGERVALMAVNYDDLSEKYSSGLNVTTGPIFVRAGAHRVSSAFLQKHTEIIDDVIRQIEHTLASIDLGDDREQTTYAHLREFEITGPFNVTGVSDTPTRRKVFTCRPLEPGDEMPCATEIVSRLARKAYRRPVNDEDLEGLMTFYELGRDEGDFEAGIRMALQALLTSPEFLFKLEPPPPTATPGQRCFALGMGDLEHEAVVIGQTSYQALVYD